MNIRGIVTRVTIKITTTGIEQLSASAEQRQTPDAIAGVYRLIAFQLPNPTVSRQAQDTAVNIFLTQRRKDAEKSFRWRALLRQCPIWGSDEAFPSKSWQWPDTALDVQEQSRRD